MKWARVKGKSQPGIQKGKDAEQEKKNEDTCYDYFSDQPTMEKEMIKDENLWVDTDFKFHFQNPEKDYPVFQRNYELYCGGYLDFYDRVVRNKAVDHTILFKWFPEKVNNKYTGDFSVKIYMTPAPMKPISNYTKINGRHCDEHYMPKNSKASVQKMSTDDEERQGGFSVDPPKPTGPPPPPMH